MVCEDLKWFEFYVGFFCSLTTKFLWFCLNSASRLTSIVTFLYTCCLASGWSGVRRIYKQF